MLEKIHKIVPLTFDKCSHEEYPERVKNEIATSKLFIVKHGTRILAFSFVMTLEIIAVKALDNLKKM